MLSLCEIAATVLARHGRNLAQALFSAAQPARAVPAFRPLVTSPSLAFAVLPPLPQGLVCASRTDLQHHKRPFAHDVPPCRTLEEAIQALRPSVLIGVSTMAGAFSRGVLEVRGGAALCSGGQHALDVQAPGRGQKADDSAVQDWPNWLHPRDALPPALSTCAMPAGHGGAERAASHHAALQPHQ